MNSKRYRLILIGILAICALAFAGAAYMGLSLLGKKSAEMVDLKLQNKNAEAKLDNLEASKKDIQKYAYFKSVASSVIPNDKDQAQAVLEINQIAQAAGIAIQSITFPTSDLTTKTSSASSKSNVISQAKPVSGIPGLYSLQLIVTPQVGANIPSSKIVTFDKMLDFLNRIENNRRTAQIAQVVIQPSDGQINFSMELNVFIKP